MTATYTNDPANRPIDRVRFEVGDTNTTTAKLSDEEIAMLIGDNNHILYAAAAAAEAIGGQSASGVSSKSVGDFSISFPTGSDGGGLGSYSALAAALRNRAASKAASKLYAGGISKSDKTEMVEDADRVQPQFTIGMNDNPTAASGVVMDF